MEFSPIRNCGVCQRSAAAETLDTHHRKPQSTDGGDEASNLVDICQNCHQFIHRLVHVLRKGNTQKVAHLLHSNYADYPQKTHDLILDLAKTALLEEDTHVRTEESVVNLPLKLKMPVYTKLREIAKGSQCSMEKMLIELIEKEHRVRKFGVPSTSLQGMQRLPKP